MISTPLLTIDQVAELCQVSAKTVYRAVSNGKLRASRLGRGSAYRIRLEDVDAWLDACALTNRAHLAQRADQVARPRPAGSLTVPTDMDRSE
jgi:excisionase family DNA binding protein